MAFTQIITVKGAEDQALHDHLAKWDTDQAGVAPGYLGSRVLADDATGEHIIAVDFSSEEEARRNNDRPETAAWASTLHDLIEGEPEYRDLREVCSTYDRS
jgi:hypothetical protein